MSLSPSIYESDGDVIIHGQRGVEHRLDPDQAEELAEELKLTASVARLRREGAAT